MWGISPQCKFTSHRSLSHQMSWESCVIYSNVWNRVTWHRFLPIRHLSNARKFHKSKQESVILHPEKKNTHTLPWVPNRTKLDAQQGQWQRIVGTNRPQHVSCCDAIALYPAENNKVFAMDDIWCYGSQLKSGLSSGDPIRVRMQRSVYMYV